MRYRDEKREREIISLIGRERERTKESETERERA